ncbi:hypothetical protein B0H14DRAFT_2998861 [Mycena olivaceomarginata]|nr:hypothetical protein B0H14DRAFT_2998861 [Mycena olivaceomarginata]
MNFPVLFQGGSGGKGGAGGKKTTGTRHADGDTRGKTLLDRLFETLPYFFGQAANSDSKRTRLYGGTGGEGGPGTHRGGEGGLGEASKIGIEYISFFSKIFGGIGGKGGFGGLFGGQGGTGQGSTFSELLVRVDENAWRAPPTPLVDFGISDGLRQRLYDHGFATVGGLFEVTGDDLREVGFEVGHIATLKEKLEAFLRK